MRGLVFLCVIMAFLFVSCSTEETAEQSSEGQNIAADTSTSSSFVEVTVDSTRAMHLGDESRYAPPDSVVSDLLEKARQHYLSALTAENVGDSARSAAQFEAAISILDGLSVVPDIENNAEFNDLSKAVIEDYEANIARIDSLGPGSSVFALREKLNQITEASDSTGATAPIKVVQGTTVPLVVNRLVEQNIAFFQGRGREHMERWLMNAGRYYPVVTRIFREEGLPDELIYLSMIESGINPRARSWARAVGMWQFMKGTGRLYGLESNFWYDERRDFEKASRAAARHLKDLHEEFGDWYLALAAYNSGAGRVYRGIRRSHSTDYWEMRRYLPRETRNYVPSYIAVTIIAMSPKDFGFGDVQPGQPLVYEKVAVDDCVDLDILARCASTEVDTLQDLNPELTQWCTPPGMRGYTLRVPPGSAVSFKEKYAAVPADQKRDWIVHKVKKGETLSHVAAQYGVPVSVIQETNHMGSAKRLSTGRMLVVPVPKGSERFASMVVSSARINAEPPARRSKRDRSKVSKALADGSKHGSVNPKNKDKVIYSVKKGDTLGHIAEWYGCRAADLRNWNDIPYGDPIHPGQALTIWVPKSEAVKYRGVDSMSLAQKESLKGEKAKSTHKGENGDENALRYVVKKGDTLEKIASTQGVSIQQLKRWNNLRKNTIYAGQELIIYPEAKDVGAMSGSKSKTGSENRGASSHTRTYVVKKGDTLWDIALAHSVDPAQLRAWNNLTRDKITVGQELKIYIGGEPVSRAE